jgi:hypothetical protein
MKSPTEMKLFFNKKEYYGQWFWETEVPEGFTEKAPPNTGYVFDDEQDDWIPKPIPEITPEQIEEE